MKKLLLGLIIFLVILVGIGTSIGVFVFFSSSIMRSRDEVREEIVYDICKSHGDFTESDYKVWFSESFRESNNFNETKERIAHIFPNHIDCENILSGNILDMIKSEETISVIVRDGTKFVQVSFLHHNDQQITLSLIDSKRSWIITEISLTHYTL
ncbi:hypothetical protein GF362_07715 [Candidatus Dojkabacteria bacterium]|nr:hypothetical protein [Candidatus Dojkabacteria bacterium]